MRKESRKPPRVIQHFPSLSQTMDINPLTHMFAQDIHTTIMPIGGSSDRHKDFSIRFEGVESEVQKAIFLTGTLSEHERRDVTRLICDAVHQVAMHLAWQGNAVYEIVKDDVEEGKYFLHGFTTQRLYHVPGYYVQWLPQEELQYFKKRFVIVQTNDIWEISMPQVLGGHLGFRRVLSHLKKYNQMGPKFWRDDMEKGIQDNNYEFQRYAKEHEVYLTRVTEQWGWNRRDYTQENCTEFYTFYKIISFKCAQTVLREHIINEMNLLLIRLGISAQIVVTGLPSSEDILAIRQKLIEGKIDFDQAYDSASI